MFGVPNDYVVLVKKLLIPLFGRVDGQKLPHKCRVYDAVALIQ